MTTEVLRQKFAERFGESESPTVTVFSPGRVNLIGEHIDYNGGHVFPAALTIGTYILARKRDDRKLRFFSENFPSNGIYEWTLPVSGNDKTKGFSNYFAGMIWAYQEKLKQEVPCGMDILIWGNIPNASGLSSSASCEVGMGKVLNLLFGFDVSNETIALTGQFSENRFNNVNCGIMDQFAVAMGRENEAIFLDTADLSYQYLPFRLGDYRLMIICTNKKRGLADSKYNERRSECEEALRDLQKELPIRNLCELSAVDFERNTGLIQREVCVRRARHAITEEERTRNAVTALQNGDLISFGAYLNASHRSLKEDYEVTGPELDTIWEESLKIPGVLGARMTGAGFGGSAIALVHQDAVNRFREILSRKYKEKIGYDCSFYESGIGDGTRELKEV